MFRIGVLPAVVAIAVAGLSAACTTTTITPEVAELPSLRVEVIAVGEVSSADPLWQGQLLYFRRALVERLREAETGARILEPGPETLGRGTIRLSGTITEVDKGNRFLRNVVGFGAGRARIAGVFEIHDGTGTLLARFESRKAYAGGFGLRGPSFLDMDDLAEKLGQETADTVVKWLRGVPL